MHHHPCLHQLLLHFHPLLLPSGPSERGHTQVNLSTSDGIVYRSGSQVELGAYPRDMLAWITDHGMRLIETLQRGHAHTHSSHGDRGWSCLERPWDELMMPSESCSWRAVAYSDLDCHADTIERDDSTSGIGHHTAGAGDSLTRTGDDITYNRGHCYCITIHGRTHMGPATAGAIQRRLVAVLRLDFVMSSDFCISPTKYTV
ncbi:hypothetical protein Tco_0419353 [Tanacetum coccineum]